MGLPQGVRAVASRTAATATLATASRTPQRLVVLATARALGAQASQRGRAAEVGAPLLIQRRHNTGGSLGSLMGAAAGAIMPEGGQSRSGALAAPRFHVGVVVVPQQIAWVVERFGKFHTILEPGLHFLIPVVDRVAYSHSLKEESIAIPNQQAITKDNVTINIDGVLFLKVLDPYKASYGVHEPILAVMQLAQTTMRSEIGKMTLDKTFEERDEMNAAIVRIVNKAAEDEWGIRVLRYEIRDIIPPQSIKQAMEMQAEAERRRRAEVLQSEGDRQSEVNLAEGKRQAAILRAEGEAQAILERAKATSEGIRLLSAAMTSSQGGEKAAALRIAEQWVGAWKEMARQSNTIIVPSNPGDASSMVATAMSIFKQVNGEGALGPSTPIPPADGRLGYDFRNRPPEEDSTSDTDSSTGRT